MSPETSNLGQFNLLRCRWTQLPKPYCPVKTDKRLFLCLFVSFGYSFNKPRTLSSFLYAKAIAVNEEEWHTLSANSLFQKPFAMPHNGMDGDLVIVRVTSMSSRIRVCSPVQLLQINKDVAGSPRWPKFTFIYLGYYTSASQIPTTGSSSRNLRLPEHMKSTDFQRFLPELLGQIFEECLPDFDNYRISRISSANLAPLKLGRVCSHWRQVTLSTQALWDRIELTKSFYAEDMQEVAIVDRIVPAKLRFFWKGRALAQSRSGCRACRSKE